MIFKIIPTQNKTGADVTRLYYCKIFHTWPKPVQPPSKNLLGYWYGMKSDCRRVPKWWICFPQGQCWTNCIKDGLRNNICLLQMLLITCLEKTKFPIFMRPWDQLKQPLNCFFSGYNSTISSISDVHELNTRLHSVNPPCYKIHVDL